MIAINWLKGTVAAVCSVAILGISAPLHAELSQEYKEAGFGALPAASAKEEGTSILDRIRRARLETRRAKADANQQAPAAVAASVGENVSPAGAVTESSKSVPVTAEPSVHEARQTVAATNKSKQDDSLWGRVRGIVGLEQDDGVTASLAASATPAVGPVISAEYLLGPGDVVGITAWRDESLTRAVVILPDGTFSFPLIGEMQAAGKTVAALKTELEKKLSRYITGVDLTVEVKQSNSMLFYVIGRVNGPGRHVMLANTSVLQALAMAGGPNPFARKGDIRIFRNESGATSMYSFDYDAVVRGKNLESNIELKRGDVIVVP